MPFSRNDDGDQSTLHLEGSLDEHSAEEFKALADALVAEGRRQVVLDMSALTNLETAGVAAIMGLHMHIRNAGGQVQIAGINGQPLAVFRLLRYDKVFTL